MNRKQSNIIAISLLLLFTACSTTPVPKPRGYFRIDLPQANYHKINEKHLPYSFYISDYAYITPHKTNDEKYFIDIIYPQWGLSVHCTYKVINNNLPMLTDDAFDFVYKHAGKATAIPEIEYSNNDNKVYGIFFKLQGNTASPYQFFLTDSIENFFRAATYFNAIPNQDSLQPVIDYLEADLKQMIETFEWQ